jgi:DNA-binding NarL/FixJ family response regulator
VREVLTAGARGFLLKSDADKLLYAALDALAHRKPFFTGQVSEALLALYLSQPVDAGGLGLLTPREREVIQLIAEGNSSRAVGTILNISTKTAEAHRASAMGKLQINSTASLVRYAIRNKIIDP